MTMVAMLLFLICLLLLFAMSLITFAGQGRRRARTGPASAMPPTGWGDVPVSSLGLFERQGRIHQTGNRPPILPIVRLQTLEETQAYMLERVNASATGSPHIGLRLSHREGPDWTDVMLDGVVIAHVPTTALAARSVG